MGSRNRNGVMMCDKKKLSRFVVGYDNIQPQTMVDPMKCKRN